MRKMQNRWVSEDKYNILKVTKNDLYDELLYKGYYSIEERNRLLKDDNKEEFEKVINDYYFQGFIFITDIMIIAKTDEIIWFIVDNDNQFIMSKDGFKMYDRSGEDENIIMEKYINNKKILYIEESYIYKINTK